jgi:hypothetical protein
MRASTDYCKIPGPYGYKYPKLSELHIKLFGEDFKEAHDASADTNAPEKRFWEPILCRKIFYTTLWERQ